MSRLSPYPPTTSLYTRWIAIALIVAASNASVRGDTLIERVVLEVAGGQVIVRFRLLHVPVRWCAVQGSPAVTDPAGVGEPDTDSVLLRRLEVLSDHIWVPQSGIAFRSAIPAGIQMGFPVIPDPLDAPGQQGDILDPAVDDKTEMNLVLQSCENAWQTLEDALRAQHVDFNAEGPVAVNIRTFVDDAGQPTGLAGWGGSIKHSTDAAADICKDPGSISSNEPIGAVVVDNAFLRGDDPHDVVLAHELGHVLFLGHGNGRDDDDNGVFDSFCDSDEDPRAPPDTIMTPGSHSESISIAGVFPDGFSTVFGQHHMSRAVALVTHGTQIDPPGSLVNADTISDHKVDSVQDITDRSIDLVTVAMTENTPKELTVFSHSLFGTIPPPAFPELDDRQYLVFADLDNDSTTGGSPADLGFLTAFTGAELITRVLVHYEVGGEFRTAIPTIWRFQGGGFVEILDPGIFANVLTSILPDTGAAVADAVSIRMPNTVRGPAGTHVRLQASAQRLGSKPELDRLPDDPIGGSGSLVMIPPQFPVANVTASELQPGAASTLEASGLLPNTAAEIFLAGQLIATGVTDASGGLTAPFVVPGGASAGFQQIVVRVPGTGLTANGVVKIVVAAAVDIKPTSCPNPLKVNDRGNLPVAILGTSTFDVSRIEPTLVTLEGVSPLRSALEDVATPFAPFTGRTQIGNCTIAGYDGFIDLTLRFDAQAVIAALGPVSDGAVRVLKVKGFLKPEFGGTSFEGEDVVVFRK